jgi:lycopene cyclase domain-containing protein
MPLLASAQWNITGKREHNQIIMTYGQFLIVFLALPLLILGVVNWREGNQNQKTTLNSVPFWFALTLHVFVAVVYTTPWDNYLVATGVWYYYPDFVIGVTIGWVPLEEYLFFVLQTLLTGGLMLYLSRHIPLNPEIETDNLSLRLFTTLGLGVIWLISLGLYLSTWEAFTYLGLILIWALPPVALQTAFGADILWNQRQFVFLSLAIPTFYLSIADSLAIEAGIWTIDPHQSLNIFLAGRLPLEEFIFFWMTNTLIVFGMTLLLSRASRTRFYAIVCALHSFRSPRKPGITNQ